MSNNDFNELAGRIQGLGDFVMRLTAELEFRQLIDGERFTRGICKRAEDRFFDGEHLEATKRTLNEMTRFLNEARQRRQQAQATQPRQRQRRYYR